MVEASPSPHLHSRRQAILLLAAGLILGGAAIFLVLRDRAAAPAPPTARIDAEGIYPVASLFGIDAARTSSAQPDAGHLAPDFTIHLPDGSTARLSDYRGRPLILNFWATWCPPCRQEMPDLVRVYEAHKAEGLVVIALNESEGHEQVSGFVEEFGMTMPVVIDPQGDVMQAFKTQSLPSSFFIDRDGVVRVRWVGFLPANALDQNLDLIL
ncbi:MAG: TlpA family protein disulfide reductase [Caldilineales bacterium]|nr:TlpA family protein disulfide reductase [Caldilineales bacterium]